jgi:hypothetical protein
MGKQFRADCGLKHRTTLIGRLFDPDIIVILLTPLSVQTFRIYMTAWNIET